MKKMKIKPSTWILPLPTLLVGTYNEDGTPNAMAAAWTAPCSQKPVCVGFAVRHSRKTWQNVQLTQAFTLNVPKASQAASVDFLGIVSGYDEPGKVARAGLEVAPSEKVDAPVFVDCPVALECAVKQTVDLGSHLWVVGEVGLVWVDEDLLSEDAKLDVGACDPIVYETTNRNYHRLGPFVAPAFSEGKKIQAK